MGKNLRKAFTRELNLRTAGETEEPEVAELETALFGEEKESGVALKPVTQKTLQEASHVGEVTSGMIASYLKEKSEAQTRAYAAVARKRIAQHLESFGRQYASDDPSAPPGGFVCSARLGEGPKLY